MNFQDIKKFFARPANRAYVMAGLWLWMASTCAFGGQFLPAWLCLVLAIKNLHEAELKKTIEQHVQLEEFLGRIVKDVLVQRLETAAAKEDAK
jgi:hypothetical protein